VLGGGLAVVGAIGFLAVFAYLAARFNYPEVLEGSAEDVLPALLATGNAGRAAWAFYAILPVIWLPAGVGAFEALRDRARGPMRLALMFALVAAVSMMLGLMRWPSIHWELARAWAASGASERVVLAAIFDGLNRYLGNFIGEFLGELAFSAFFILAGMGLLRRMETARWLGWSSVAVGVAGMIGMWRNVTPLVAPVAGLNNYLLPLWMLVFGGWMIRLARRADQTGAH
jgi:hypothetical protein